MSGIAANSGHGRMGGERGGKRANTSTHLVALANALDSRFGPVASAVPDDNHRNAAVALVLRRPPGAADAAVRSCDVLVVRRAESPRDPWSGQMALPGGSLDPSDDGLLAAAIREAREETGLLLGVEKGVLGRIATVRPVGARLPVITIWPFVFHVPYDAAAGVASPEVASVHWFPVAELADTANHGSYLWREAGLVRRFPSIQVGGRVIWGLTYRILTRFLDLV